MAAKKSKKKRTQTSGTPGNMAQMPLIMPGSMPGNMPAGMGSMGKGVKRRRKGK
jgi:hypothetical protein